jgi:hypothetical protein
MHTNSIFDEIVLVENLATRLRTSYREMPISNKNKGMQSMQIVELYLTESSSIVWLSILLRPVKGKPIKTIPLHCHPG